MTVTTDEAGTELDVSGSEDEELVSAALESELEVDAADAPVLSDTVWRLWLATATSRGSAATDRTAERVRRRVTASDRMLMVDSSALGSWRKALRKPSNPRPRQIRSKWPAERGYKVCSKRRS